MHSKILSVVTGTANCIAQCSFCVSGEKNGSCEKRYIYDTAKFSTSLKYAKTCGVDTIVITSRGEPLLEPEMISMYLKQIKNEAPEIPFIELQTNGILLEKMASSNAFEQKAPLANSYLKEWRYLGLTHIAISIVSEKQELNAYNYLGSIKANYPDLSRTIMLLHHFGFSVRLACVMCKGYTDNIDKINELICFAKNNLVEQLTLRPVNEEYRRKTAHEWIEEHKFSDIEKRQFYKYLYDEGTVLLELRDSLGINNIKLEMPYIPNARMDRVEDTKTIFTLKYFCKFINELQFSSVDVKDPHSYVSVALLNNVNVEQGYPYEYLVEDINKKLNDYQIDTVFFPDEGATKRYAKNFNEQYAYGSKHRNWLTGEITGYEIISDFELKDKNILIVDDISSYGGTFYHAAKKLKELGANHIVLIVTHCENSILEGSLPNSGLIDKVFTTYSIFTKEDETDFVQIIR